MKKIVHYIPGLINGGIESMLLNYYSKLNKDFKFVIIVHGQIEENCRHNFEKLGAKIYKIPHWTESIVKHNKELYKILKNEKPDIFHTHHNVYNFLPCFIAYKAGIKIRISHCHNYYPTKSFKEKVFCKLSYLFSTNSAACGKGAAEYLTSKKKVEENKVKIIYNAIDLKKYKYDEEVRKKIRKELKWENKYIYINVGRYCEQKNQLFLIDIYERIYEINKNARFLIIGGTGDKYEEVLNKVNKSKIKEQCILLKNIKNVDDYYSASDCLILPSLYEGFAVSVIESQASALPCVLSPTITKEFESPIIYFSKSLTNLDDWINEIKKAKNNDRNKNNVDLKKFDITVACSDLKKYYNNLLEGEKHEK